MAWQDISASTFKVVYDDNYGSDLCEETYATLQYDDASISPTSVKLRFKYQKTTIYWYLDLIYILLYPTESTKRKLLTIKTDHTESTAGWPYYSTPFTISKSYAVAKFTIPDFWICNDGYENTDNTATAFYNAYKDGVWRGDNMRCTVSAKSIAIASNKTVVTAVSKGTVNIIDNGDNSFTLQGTKGKNGVNNPVTSLTLQWGYTISYNGTFKNNSIRSLTITNPSNPVCRVYARSVTGATYGSAAIAATYLDVKQYVGPGVPGKAKISYTKSRLTIKENWTISWTAAAATNTNSPVRGYRVRVLVNDKSVQIKNASGTVISSDNGNTSDNLRYYYDTESTGTSLTFYTAYQGVKPNDKIKITVEGYTKNGKGTRVFGTTRSISDEYTVQYAGIMRTKVSNAWKEGQVHVKVNNIWKEAEVVYTKVNGVWKETD